MSMLPQVISVQNYRSFSGRHEFELRPLTLIYGANNVGKSALVRLLPLLGDSVSVDATGALRLESGATFGAGFSDLESHRRLPDEPSDLGIGLRWDRPIRESEFSFEQREREGVVIRELSLTLADGSCTRLTRTPNWDPNDPFVHEYDLRDGASVRQLKVSFRGLVPTEFPNDVLPLRELQVALIDLRGSIQWLRAQRATPARRMPRPSGPVVDLEPDGSNAPAALRRDRELEGAVSKWFKDALGRSLRLIDEPPDEFRCRLENALETSAIQIDLVDSGNGPVQVLPIVVACELAARAKQPQILALEEPDANLDIPTQRRLAALLVKTAAASVSPCLVVETHSEALLLGVQLAIADGRLGLAPEDVAIYWVEQDERAMSRLSRASIDQDGRLSGNWPDPFGQIRELARELIKIRMQRSSS